MFSVANEEMKNDVPQPQSNPKEGVKSKLKSWFKNKVLGQGDVTFNYPNGDVYVGKMSKK